MDTSAVKATSQALHALSQSSVLSAFAEVEAAFARVVIGQNLARFIRAFDLLEPARQNNEDVKEFEAAVRIHELTPSVKDVHKIWAYFTWDRLSIECTTHRRSTNTDYYDHRPGPSTEFPERLSTMNRACAP